LAGHHQHQLAQAQLLTIPGGIFTPADADSIPTGEERSVAGTPMDFHTPKPIGQDIAANYEPLKLQRGYDHNYVAAQPVCAVLEDVQSGRKMTMSTTAPGFHFYCGNYTENLLGKDGIVYGMRSGVCLEPQFFPDAVHNPQWTQPIFKAGEPYRMETTFTFDI
jgi:aldose 1-epimerase